MKHIFLLSITSILLICSCGSKNKARKTSFNNFYNVADTTTIITQTKGYCFGKCPVYKFRIRANGQAELEAIDHLKLENGKYYSIIPQATIEEIYTKALEINFFGLNEVYDNEFIQDVPATYLSLMNKENKSIKHIKDRWKSPDELKTYENFLHKLVEDIEWKAIIED